MHLFNPRALAALVAVLTLSHSAIAVPVSDGPTSSPCGQAENCILQGDSPFNSAQVRAPTRNGRPQGAYRVIAAGNHGRTREEVAAAAGARVAVQKSAFSKTSTTTTKKTSTSTVTRTPTPLLRNQVVMTTFATTRPTSYPVTTMRTSTSTITRNIVATTTVSGRVTTYTSPSYTKVIQITPVVKFVTTVQTVPVTSTITVSVSSSTSLAAKATSTTSKPSTTTSAAPSFSTVASLSDKQAVLRAHNAYRAKHNAVALTWDTTLEKYAQYWADKCIWAHSGGPFGENGGSAVGMPMSMAIATDMWYNEIYQYNFTAGQFTEATGHFTQLVWKDSTTVGCAISACQPSQLGFNWPYPDPAYNVWCEYSQNPGNIIGDFVTNVQPPTGVTLRNGMVPAPSTS